MILIMYKKYKSNRHPYKTSEPLKTKKAQNKIKFKINDHFSKKSLFIFPPLILISIILYSLLSLLFKRKTEISFNIIINISTTFKNQQKNTYFK